MRIEIITTPNESLKENGFGTLTACNRVLSAIHRLGYSVKLNVCRTKDNLAEIVKRKPDLIMLAVKYIPVNNKGNIWLSDYLDQHGINFTGSLREVMEFDSNKVLAKMHLGNIGIKSANYFIATPGQYKKESELPIPFPLFLKPLDAANGNGIDDLSFVANFANYESKILSLYNSFNQPVLVEEYLGGREFTVAIIRTLNQKLVVSAVEVIPPTSTSGLKILGAKAKKENSEELREIEDHEVKRSVTELAIEAFKGLGARDFGRIDIKMNNNGEYFFMEANLVPGMTYGSSYFPEACNMANNISYDKVVELLLSGGIARAFQSSSNNFLHCLDDKIVSPI